MELVPRCFWRAPASQAVAVLRSEGGRALLWGVGAHPSLPPHSSGLECYSPTEAEHCLGAWGSRAEGCPRLGIKGKIKPHPGARIHSKAEERGLVCPPKTIRAGAALSPADSCRQWASRDPSFCCTPGGTCSVPPRVAGQGPVPAARSPWLCFGFTSRPASAVVPLGRWQSSAGDLGGASRGARWPGPRQHAWF